MELKAELVHLANDIGCLQSEYEDFADTMALASGTARSRIEEVESTYRAINRKVRPHLSEPELNSIWMVLTTTRKDLHRRTDEATAPALTATPVTLSTKVDTRPTTLHAPTIRIN